MSKHMSELGTGCRTPERGSPPSGKGGGEEGGGEAPMTKCPDVCVWDLNH